MERCPKCSGEPVVVETATAHGQTADLTFRCSCGVSWTERGLSFQDALISCAWALSQSHWRGATLAARGLLLEMQGKADEAYEAYATALRCDDTFDRAFCHERQAAHEALQGRYAEALRSLEQALAADERASGARVAAYRDAIANLRLYVNELGQSVSPAVVIVEGMMRAQCWDQAVAAARALSPNDLVDAIGFLSRAVDRAPNAAEIQELVVRAYEMWASWSTSGGEGIARTAEVERERQRLRSLR